MDTAADKALGTRPRSDRRTALFFVLLTAMSVLPVNIYLPAIPDIADTFDASFALVNLSVAGYAVATAVTEVIAGAVSDRFGRRPVVLATVSIFIVASAGCALAPTVELLLAFRVLQAVIAACFSVAMVVIKETASEHEAVRRIGFAGMGWALAPMLGPTLGGTVNEFLGWRAIFVLLALLGGAVLVASMRQFGRTPHSSGAPETGFLVSYLRIAASPRFWAYTLCMVCATGTFYIFLGGAPMVMSERLGGSSAVLGLAMAVVPGGFVLGSYLTGVFGSRFFRTRILVAARVLTCAGVVAGLLLTTRGDLHPVMFFAACAFVGIGNGLTTPAVNLGVMSERPSLSATATGMSAALAIGGGALISSLAGVALGGSASTRMLLTLMLASASLALVAALCAAATDKVTPPRTVRGVRRSRWGFRR